MTYPSQSELEASNWDFLTTSADNWRKLADTWENAFTEVRNGAMHPGGTEWTGPAAEAYQHQTDTDLMTVRGPVNQLRDAADIAVRGRDQQEAGKMLALDAVDEARRAGFTVADAHDYAVTDTKTSYDSDAERDARAKEAQEHHEFINYRMNNLVSGEGDLNRDLTRAAQGLDTFGFGDEGADGGAGATGAGVEGPGPPPEDPQQFTDWWQSLSPEQKDLAYANDHSIGNHPGMPFEDKTHYNQPHLHELQQHAQSEVDRLQKQFDALAAQAYMGDHDSAAQASALAPQLAAAKHALDGYKAVQAEMNSKDGPKRYLGFVDDQGHAAISIGNPDTATRNAIFVPGTGQDTLAINGSDRKSLAMYQAAHDADPSQTVAVTTWMGYDRPMNVPEAAWPEPARAGAGGLDAFESGLRASHVGPASIDTVIGHSYGSTVVGAAASGGHHLDANNVIAVGSPGLTVSHAGDLNLDPDSTVYAMTARNDIIGLVTDMTLGSDPMAAGFGATRLWADPGPSSDPLGLTPSIDAHSSYWLPGNPALGNLGAVIAGLPPPEVIGPDGIVTHR